MNICVLASGAGSNFRELVRSSENGLITSQISLLITNNSDSGAGFIAKDHGVECLHISRKKFSMLSDGEYSSMFLHELISRKIDFITLCGYMKRVPENVLGHFRNRIINIHPALLPSFGGKGMYGMNVHEAVIRSGVKVSGITIHFVDGDYDLGRIIFQKCCEVSDDDDASSLSEKVKKLEHQYYPLVVRKFEEGKVIIAGDRVTLEQTESQN